MEKKNPSVWQFEHFSEVSGWKSDGLRSPGPFAFGENLRDSAPASKRGNQFSWTGYWSKNNIRSKLVFGVVQSSPYRPARRHNQAKVLLRVFWVRKRILDTLGSTLSRTQVWVSSLCGASIFHRLGVPDCRRSAWPNQQTTYVHISWYIKWLYDYFIISTVGAPTVTQQSKGYPLHSITHFAQKLICPFQ